MRPHNLHSAEWQVGKGQQVARVTHKFGRHQKWETNQAMV